MSHPIEKLFDYHMWSNSRVFDHLKGLPKEIYKQEITSVFPSVSKVVEHLYSVDAMWLNVMEQKPMEEIFAQVKAIPKQIEDLSIDEMEDRFGNLSEEYRAFFKSVDLDKVITIRHPHYGSMNAPISGLVQHVVNHGTYHRGNITAMLQQQGQSGVPTDYVIFLYNNQ